MVKILIVKFARADDKTGNQICKLKIHKRTLHKMSIRIDDTAAKFLSMVVEILTEHCWDFWEQLFVTPCSCATTAKIVDIEVDKVRKVRVGLIRFVRWLINMA